MNNKFISTAGIIGVTVIVAGCASQGPANKVVFPLDHGPRAQTTPWSNQQRQLRVEQGASTKLGVAANMPMSDSGK